jgi:seryl-tRNA synthetase
MLDIKLIRENATVVDEALKRRNPGLSVQPILALDVERRQLLLQEETLRSERNQLTQAIAQAKQAGENTEAIQLKTRQLADTIKALEIRKDELAQAQLTGLQDIPNMPSDSSPTGPDESHNVVVKTWGDELKARTITAPLPHWEIGTALGLLDAERGVKLAQSRFTVMRGLGAKLERALIQLMLDTHTQAGYEEILPPFLANTASMVGTGQLPKFADDMFKCQDDALYLIPTAEVPVTNLYRGEVLPEADLPMRFVAYTPCFRREAGSAGKDTRGLIRQHQFNKVELVKLCTPQQAEAEHLALLADAEKILQLLELPYRVMELCTGDLGFSAARCFDIEVWMPAQGVYREISSCSLFTDFQARRADLKYKPQDATQGNQLLHTINGSGLAVGRTVAAILENYQLHQMQVTLPPALLPYWQGSPPVITG